MAHLVRFDHHRLQEYLTAIYIHSQKPTIDWMDKIDAPRWQETLVNLVVMGGGDEAIDVLAPTISEPVARERRTWAEFDGKNQERKVLEETAR